MISEETKKPEQIKRRCFVASILKKIVGDIEPQMWLIKFLPLLVLQATSIFAYTLVKTAKTALVLRVTTSTTINYMKMLVITPMALLFPVLLSFVIRKLKNKREKAPYVMIVLFAAFFFVFMYFMLPYGSALHFPELIAKITAIPFMPETVANGIGTVLAYWDYSLFYGISEMVAVVFINMFAWGTANEICASQESKIFYSLFGGLTAFAGYMAAGVMFKTKLSAVTNAMLPSVMQGILLKVILALGIFFVAYFFIERYVMKNEKLMPKREVKVKPKVDQGAGYKMVMNSPYLLRIAIITLSYSLLIVIFEQCLYEAISIANPGAWSSVMAKTTQVNSMMIVVMSCFSIWLSSFPWVVRAMLPVVMMGVGGLISVFLYMISGSVAAVSTAAVVATSAGTGLVMPILFGCISNVLARSGKYTLFDNTKEELFRVSSDPDIRSKGKAVVDVAFGRIGKSGSSLMVIALLILQPMVSKLFHKKESKPDIQSVAAMEARSVIKVGMVKDKQVEVSIDLPKATSAGWRVKQSDSGFVLTKDIQDVSRSTLTKEVKAPAKVKTPTKDIAPALFVYCLVIVAMWGYAVVSIAPMYGENIKAEGRSEATSMNLSNIGLILGLSTLMLGTIYLILSREIAPIISEKV